MYALADNSVTRNTSIVILSIRERRKYFEGIGQSAIALPLMSAAILL
jgi:hypothetical protein